MNKVKVGLLPLYVKLYDDCSPQMRPTVEAFYAAVADKLKGEGLCVLTPPICRLEDEFKAALDGFEAAGADAVITLHLAYSPSLQSEKPLAACKLPIIVLDTTLDYTFKPTDPTDAISYNHGIHGVQDMCNLLIRNGVKFDIVTGHYLYSDVCKQAADLARAYVAARALTTMKVGMIGEHFEGMGDFRLPYEEMKRDIGFDIVKVPTSDIAPYTAAVTDERVAALKAEDMLRFTNKDVSDEQYDEVTRVSLGVKDWYEANGIDAFTVNFLSASRSGGLRHMIFDRACRAMEEGIGYAGEGDILTAAFVGALLKAWDETTFVEMFCPDWQSGVVFLSHMGEYNLRIAGDRPLMIDRPFPYTDTGNPYAIMASMKPGKATIVNLAPFGDGRYTLIAVEGEMQTVPENSTYRETVNGWFKPETELAETLKLYSKNGGTHHSAMVYGVGADAFEVIADKFGWKFVRI